MKKQYQNKVFHYSRLIMVASILVVSISASNSGFAQPKTRAVSKQGPASATSVVISRFIKAMQNKDFKTIVDLTYSYQVQLDAIRQQNPRALWERKTQEFYHKKVGTLTQESSFWGNYSLGFGTLTGDPAQNFRIITSFLPQWSGWQISETRYDTVTNMNLERFAQVTVYVMVEYPLKEGMQVPPLLGQKFLKSTMLKFELRSNLVENVFQVDDLNTFWQRPYPPSATKVLEDKLKADLLSGTSSAIPELENLIGEQALETYLLEVAANPPANGLVFDRAIQYLAARHVKDVVPLILKRAEAISHEWATPDRDLMKVLKQIRRTEYPTVDFIKKRMAVKIKKLDGGAFSQEISDPDVYVYLDVLASIDDAGWKSFPYANIRGIVDELDEKYVNASIVGPDATTSASRFFASFRPCTTGLFGRPVCFTNIDYKGIRVVDPWTIVVDGNINERADVSTQRRPTGKFELTLYRTPTQPQKWMMRDIKGEGGKRFSGSRRF